MAALRVELEQAAEEVLDRVEYDTENDVVVMTSMSLPCLAGFSISALPSMYVLQPSANTIW